MENDCIQFQFTHSNILEMLHDTLFIKHSGSSHVITHVTRKHKSDRGNIVVSHWQTAFADQGGMKSL